MPVAALLGGTEAWANAGLPMQSGNEGLPPEPDDVWWRPYDRDSRVKAAMKEYLTWEVDLVPQIERDGDARFRVGAAG